MKVNHIVMGSAVGASLLVSTGRATTFVPSATTRHTLHPLGNNKDSEMEKRNAASPYAKEIGALPPLGFFDPLKFTEGISQQQFDELRYCELKHGRIAMLAVVGNLVTLAGVRFPGMLSRDVAFADMPSGLAGLVAVPPAGLLQIVLFILVLEAGTSTLKGEFQGDFTGSPGQPDLNWSSMSAEWKTNKRTIELNNGRAAMMGIWGLVTHDMMGNLNEIVHLPSS